MQELPGENFGENVKWGENDRIAEYNFMKMFAFIHFTTGDCQVAWKDPKEALYRYSTSYGNLADYHFPDSIQITYKYAIRTYIYKPSFKKFMIYWRDPKNYSTDHDSLTAIKNLNDLEGISQDK